MACAQLVMEFSERFPQCTWFDSSACQTFSLEFVVLGVNSLTSVLPAAAFLIIATACCPQGQPLVANLFLEFKDTS